MTKKKKHQKNKAEIQTEVVYALRHIEKGTLLIMERLSNSGSDFCNEQTVRLDLPYGDDPGDWNPDTWYIDSAYNAEYVRNYSTEWYNSSERNPTHSFKPEQLEIVRVERVVKTLQVKAVVPTFEQYIKLKYGETEPEHCEYVLGEYKKSPRSFGTNPYSLWELMMLIENGRWDPEGDTNG